MSKGSKNQKNFGEILGGMDSARVVGDPEVVQMRTERIQYREVGLCELITMARG